jgi:hypothetical protein
MSDATLNRTLRLAVVGTIAATALACLILAYNALFDLMNARWTDAAGRAVWSAGAALASLLLTYYRGELIDD